jgi:hypothetical protein
MHGGGTLDFKIEEVVKRDSGEEGTGVKPYVFSGVEDMVFG